MPTIKSSAPASGVSVTSLTVPFGVTPAVGDLILVFLLTHSEIVTHQPGWATEFTATPNPWFKLDGVRAIDTGTLTGWYHTWNASDTGNSAVFTFVPAPSLGIGDKGLPSAVVVAVAVVLDGTNLTAVLEHNAYGTAQDLSTTITASPLKLPGQLTFHAVAAKGTTASWSDSDSSAVLVNSATTSGDGHLSLAIFADTATPTGYSPTFTLADGVQSLMVQAVSVSDNQPQLYNPPFIEEGPMGQNALMYRYRLNRFFTVLNNSGTFSAVRYQSTDQIAAATQVFVNNQPITTTDRTNILNSGVGGDYRAVT